ncbi:hypothetical protein MNBD_GAMMA08-3141, partial [hydrothermal vent metagenome]
MAAEGNIDDQLRKIAEYIISMSGGRSSSMYQNRQTTDGTGRGSQKEDIIEQSKLSSAEIKKLNKTMMELGKEKFDLSQVERLPNEFRKSLMGINTKFSKELADNIKTLDDALAVKEQVDQGILLVAELKKFKKGQKMSAVDIKRLGDIARKAGVNVNEFIDTNNKLKNTVDKLDAEFTELGDALDKSTKNTMKWSKGVNKATFLINKFSSRLIEAGKVYADELRIARERGAYDAQYSDALFKMGVSMKAYTVLLADNRDVMQSVSASGSNFKTALFDNVDAIKRYSRDNEQAAQSTAMLMRALTGFGTKVRDVDGALKNQVKLYEENFFIWGDTMEEYAKSMVALGEDTDIRRNLSMMQEKQRREYIKGIAAQESYRRELGYSKEEARELTKVFAAMGGESPKERMKKAAKQRALLGALGMGSEGAELQQLMTGLNQLNPEDRANAEKRIEDIQRQMANTLKGKFSESLGSEMFFRAMAEKAGVVELSDKLETNSKEAKTKDKADAQSRADGRKVPSILSKGLDLYDTFNAFQATSVGLLAGILAALIGGQLLGGIGKIFKGGFGGIGKIFKGGFGMLSKGIGKIAALAVGAFAATKAIAAVAAKGIGSAAVAATKTAAAVSTKGAGSAAAAATKAAGGLAVAGAAGKTLSKTAIKMGIKAIPGLGALAGIGFGISRAMDGDFLGAGLEVAAGVAGILPGWGTAASVAISGGLAARDITSSGETGRSADQTNNTTNVSTTNKTPNKDSKDGDFISALSEMTTYIREVNTQNTELATSVQTLASTLNNE